MRYTNRHFTLLYKAVSRFNGPSTRRVILDNRVFMSRSPLPVKRGPSVRVSEP